MDSNQKHLLHWKDWDAGEIREVLELAVDAKLNPEKYAEALKAKTLVMLFQKTSTRTRVSFEAGMTELGGHAIYLDWRSSNFGLTRTWYEAAYLSTNAHILMARVKEHSELQEIAKGSRVPVINGCDDKYHPCQALADMLTIRLDRGSLEGAKLTYVGVMNNVSNSLVSLAPVFGVQLTLVCPVAPKEDRDHEVLEQARQAGVLVETLDAKAAVKDADYVYTDTWVNMEYFNDPSAKELKEERIRTMLPYQVNADLLKGSAAKVMHDMPIHPGYEIAEELVEEDRSIIFEQASNRLPAQKAIMLRLLGKA
ncbi:MAG: ornithine carbamoyltransferase [bacterium]|nr:ornithine carbamoyltransferase [bacterium]